MLAVALIMLYFGQASFITTSLIYFTLGILLHRLSNYTHLNVEAKLFSFSVLFAMYIAEFLLRFVIAYPITYGEKNGGGYGSEYLSQPIADYIDMKIYKKKNMHTIEFVPGSLRNCADAENMKRPQEVMNAIGTRGKLPKKNSNVVLCLGDSYTESVCTTIDSSYPIILERQLSAKDSNIEVINAGISGSDPFYEFKLLQKIEPKYKIKAAVFLLNTTDLNDYIINGGNERFQPDGTSTCRATPWWERIYAFSFVFRLFTHNVLKLDYTFHTSKQTQQLKKEAVDKIVDLIHHQIAPYCNHKEIKLVIALQPIESELALQNQEDYNMLRNALMLDSTICFIDTYNDIATASHSNTLYYKVDGHFNGIGYNILGKAIAKKWNF